MNKELIEALEECQKAFDNLCGNSMMYKPLRVNIKKALQKAKEQLTEIPKEEIEERRNKAYTQELKPSKAEEFDLILFMHKNKMYDQEIGFNGDGRLYLTKAFKKLLESYSNQRKKTITEKEIVINWIMEQYIGKHWEDKHLEYVSVSVNDSGIGVPIKQIIEKLK